MIKNDNNEARSNEMNERQEIATGRGLWVLEWTGNVAWIEYTSRNCNSMTKWSVLDGKILTKTNIIGNTDKIHSDVWKVVA